MISKISVQNFALIQSLEIQPSEGLNIITGETGAGKSIMLGALGLLQGNRADVKSLFDENQKCVIEAIYEIKDLDLEGFFEENELEYDENCIIRREIAPNGKSRAFINDSPVTLDILKELGGYLMDIHSQHDNLLLNNSSYQLKLIDEIADNKNLMTEFKQSFKQFRNLENQYKKIQTEAESLQKEFEFNSFLLNELNDAKLDGLDLTELESELAVLENAEEVKRRLGLVNAYINESEVSALNLLKEANASLSPIAGFSKNYAELKDRLSSIIIELQDIETEISSVQDKVEIDPAQLSSIQEKVNAVHKLLSKHRVEQVADLITIRTDLATKVNQVMNFDEEIAKLKKEKDSAWDKTNELGQRLSKSRKDRVPILISKIEIILNDLGLTEANFNIDFTEKKPSEDGFDDIKFMFSANKGTALKPIKDMASGGEYSRLMLALKYILAEKNKLPTIIFDEIDTGISGEVALKVGKILASMSKNLQVIVITHLPQIAGKGNTHFFVYKDNSSNRTVSKMRLLNNQEREHEIAVMIGGNNPSESAYASAKELLSN